MRVSWNWMNLLAVPLQHCNRISLQCTDILTQSSPRAKSLLRLYHIGQIIRIKSSSKTAPNTVPRNKFLFALSVSVHWFDLFSIILWDILSKKTINRFNQGGLNTLEFFFYNKTSVLMDGKMEARTFWNDNSKHTTNCSYQFSCSPFTLGMKNFIFKGIISLF